MRSKRWADAAIAVLFAVVVLVVARVAISLVPAAPIHKDAASVPSTAAVADTVRYSGPVEESRELARTLVAGDNLPGLSVAIAVDGEIVWAEGFGRADVEGRTPITPPTASCLGRPRRTRWAGRSAASSLAAKRYEWSLTEAVPVTAPSRS